MKSSNEGVMLREQWFTKSDFEALVAEFLTVRDQ
jgi:hypothetical protein